MSASNYTLKYRTFDTLLADAQSDLQKLYQENYIEPHQLIKVAMRVNYDLGLRIYQTKEELLEVENGRVRLPNDFFTLNYAFVCDEYTVKQAVPQGTHVEERPLSDVVPTYQWIPNQIDTCSNPPEPTPCNTCAPNPCGCATADSCSPTPRVCLNCKGEAWELVQLIKYETRVYKSFFPLEISSTERSIECGCPNLYMESKNKARIKDGWLYTNFTSGKVYINYQGSLEDNDGNILVPDHPRLNEYYEYALKERIIENMIMNDAPVSQLKLQLVTTKLREARNNARSLVSMPNFEELKKVWEVNRKAQYNRFYQMFRTTSWVNNNRYYGAIQ